MFDIFELFFPDPGGYPDWYIERQGQILLEGFILAAREVGITVEEVSKAIKMLTTEQPDPLLGHGVKDARKNHLLN